MAGPAYYAWAYMANLSDLEDRYMTAGSRREQNLREKISLL
ncbi:MAG: hypothetical protein ACLRQC_12890 [Dorea formicigenerans]